MQHPEITARIHGITFRTLLKIIRRVAEALAFKASRYLRMPCLLAEKQKVTKSFYDLAHMSQVIGAVIYTKVKCKRSNSDNDTQIKPDEFLHIQIVSDADFKIRDLDFRFKSAAGKVFTAAELFIQTRIKERFEQNEFRGRLLLGDSLMKCSSSLYTPVTCALTLAEQAFNNAHRLTYEPARICLKLWRKRFAILDREWHGSSSTNRHIVVALALLHNMAVEWNDSSISK